MIKPNTKEPYTKDAIQRAQLPKKTIGVRDAETGQTVTRVGRFRSSVAACDYCVSPHPDDVRFHGRGRSD